MSSNSKRKLVRSTQAQLRLLVYHMAANRLFAKNEFPGPMGPQNLEARWASLTDLLAEHGPHGPAKSADQWKIYNNILRMLLRLPKHCSASGMFAEARLDDFFAIRRKRVASMLRRVRESSNGLLRAMAERLDCPITKFWVEVAIGRAR